MRENSGGGLEAVLTAWATADSVETVMEVATRALRSEIFALEKIPESEVLQLDIRVLTRRKCIGMNPQTAVLPDFQ